MVTNETTSVRIQDTLSLSLTRSSERSWFVDVDTTGVTVGREDIPGVVFAQVDEVLKAATKPRTTVIAIFVFIFDATLIIKDKE